MSSDFGTREGPDPKVRRHELAAEGDHHPSPEVIGQLLELEPSAMQADPAAEHVIRCRRCFALYAEMVQTEFGARAIVRAESALPTGFLESGLRIARGGSTRKRHRPIVRPILAMAGALMVVAAIAFRGADQRRSHPVALDLVSSVNAAVWWALPEDWVFEDRIRPVGGPILRDRARMPDRPDLGDLIHRLIALYDDKTSHTQEVAELLVMTLLADDDTTSAREYLTEARAEFPKSHNLAFLEAALDYRTDQLDDAESTLRQLASRDSDAAVALALLLREQGEPGQATAILRNLEATRGPGDPIVEHLRNRLASPPETH